MANSEQCFTLYLFPEGKLPEKDPDGIEGLRTMLIRTGCSQERIDKILKTAKAELEAETKKGK
jgi:hypothetical protein